MRKTDAQRGQSLSQRHTTIERERERLIQTQPAWLWRPCSYWWGSGYAKTWHLGILNISSWRNFRNGRYRKDFLTFTWSKSWDPPVRGALPIPGVKEYLSLKSKDDDWDLNEPSQTGPLSVFPASGNVTLMYLLVSLALSGSSLPLTCSAPALDLLQFLTVLHPLLTAFAHSDPSAWKVPLSNPQTLHPGNHYSVFRSGSNVISLGVSLITQARSEAPGCALRVPWIFSSWHTP